VPAVRAQVDPQGLAPEEVREEDLRDSLLAGGLEVREGEGEQAGQGGGLRMLRRLVWEVGGTLGVFLVALGWFRVEARVLHWWRGPENAKTRRGR
jgi:hypothetical protein